MNNFMNKARSGRENALAKRQDTDRYVDAVSVPKVKFKSSRSYDPIPFISSRAQVQTTAWLH